MKVAIYIRVSTEEQAQHGFSIDVQKERLIAFCASQGWTDTSLYIDDGYTGTNLNRPAMKRMLRHIEERKINAVVVYKLDRLSRKQKDVMYLLEDVFEKNGVIFKSNTEPFDTSTPFGKAMIGVLAVFAQLERDMIVERTTSGRRESVDQGNWPGGRVPFGYSWNKETKTLEIVPEEAHIVREIYSRYLKGQSRLAIAEWASNRSKARVFDHSVIREILSRPVYIGKLKNAGKLVDGKHDAIIDEMTWYSAQRERNERKEGLSPMGEFLLTGLLSCGVCGSGIVHVKRTTKPRGKAYSYELYACKNQHVRIKERNTSCSLGYQRREQVEQFVINQIKEISLKPHKLKEISEKKTNPNSDRHEETIRLLTEKHSVIVSGLDNLYDAIAKGEIKASHVSGRIKKLEEERETIENQIDELKDEIPFSTSQFSNSAVFQIITSVGETWEYLTEEEQKSLLRKVILKIELRPKDTPYIYWNVH